MLKQLSQILEQDYGVSEESFKEAQKLRAEQNANLTDILLKKQIVSESQLLEAYSKLYAIPFASQDFY